MLILKGEKVAINDAERLNSNNSALYCYGTAYIFEQRVTPLRIAIKILLFSSLAGPLVIGALVIAVGTKGTIIKWALIVAAILSFIQIIVSLWSLVAQWQNKLPSYENSIIENHLLSNEFKDLANNNILSDSEWRTRSDVLEVKGEFQKRKDLTQSISEEEKRMGMRYALRFFGRQCVGCSEVPITIETSDCPVCGQFKTRKFKWLM